MILIVGLGNPGKKYQGTRHNAGHMVVDELEKLNPAGFILVKTDAFMNESGKAVKRIIKNLKLLDHAGTPRRVAIKNLVVVHDDIDLPIGTFKIQKGRGAAGHKGVQSIIDELGTKDFWRIRIGICPKDLPAGRHGGKPQNVEKFVLQEFTKNEQKALENIFTQVISEVKRLR